MKNLWCPKGATVIRAHLLASLCSDKKNGKGLRKQEALPGNCCEEQSPKIPAWLWWYPCPLHFPFTSFSASRLVAGIFFLKKKCITD